MKAKHCSFAPLVSPFDVTRPVDWARQFGRAAPTDVEIGFGMGEVLMRMARERPERNLIGIEQHWERICKTLRAMTRAEAAAPGVFANIRILKTDARVVFERLIAPKSIDTVICLFPCPWPKKGHVKHRLFDKSFLRLVNNRLKNGGRVQLVTDFHPYFTWVLDEARGTGFRQKTSTVRPQYDTKFERKWCDEGQSEFFRLDLVKHKHLRVAVEKDAPLKSYTLKQFDAKRLRLKDEKGPVTVVFKDSVFDEDKKIMMIHALVAEEHLTQHFWIAVMQKAKTWRVVRADGQNFFPTPGIARALELVYETAKETSQ